MNECVGVEQQRGSALPPGGLDRSWVTRCALSEVYTTLKTKQVPLSSGSLATATPVTRDVLRAPGVTHTGFGRRSVRKIFPQRRVEAVQKRSGKEPNAETRGVWFYLFFLCVDAPWHRHAARERRGVMKAGECLPAALKLRLSHTVGRMPPLHASLCEFSGDLKPLTVTL